QLDDAQRQKVAAWIGQGLSISDIQNRLASEVNLRLTYMQVRFLVDDLKLVPKDVERAKSGAGAGLQSPAAPSAAAAAASKTARTNVPQAGGVSLSVDQLARPGTMVSGKVTFSDGNTADWYYDQTGRLGLVPQQNGYRPGPEDVEEFRI